MPRFSVSGTELCVHCSETNLLNQTTTTTTICFIIIISYAYRQKLIDYYYSMEEGKTILSVILNIYIWFCVLDLQQSSIVEFLIIMYITFGLKQFSRINHKNFAYRIRIYMHSCLSERHWLVIYCWRIRKRVIELIWHRNFRCLQNI